MHVTRDLFNPTILFLMGTDIPDGMNQSRKDETEEEQNVAPQVSTTLLVSRGLQKDG